MLLSCMLSRYVIEPRDSSMPDVFSFPLSPFTGISKLEFLMPSNNYSKRQVDYKKRPIHWNRANTTVSAPSTTSTLTSTTSINSQSANKALDSLNSRYSFGSVSNQLDNIPSRR